MILGSRSSTTTIRRRTPMSEATYLYGLPYVKDLGHIFRTGLDTADLVDPDPRKCRLLTCEQEAFEKRSRQDDLLLLRFEDLGDTCHDWDRTVPPEQLECWTIPPVGSQPEWCPLSLHSGLRDEWICFIVGDQAGTVIPADVMRRIAYRLSCGHDWQTVQQEELGDLLDPDDPDLLDHAYACLHEAELLTQELHLLDEDA